MSLFLPLNLTEDTSSKKALEDEQSRELAIEQAFKVFEQALAQQKRHEWADAYYTYKKLFQVEVISNHYYEEEDYLRGLQNGTSVDELSFLAPNVKSLRYLVFRNRGFLHLEILKRPDVIDQIYATEKKDDLSRHDLFKELFYVMVDDFVVCVFYQEADEKLLHTMYDLFEYLGLRRMARFTLEYLLSGKTESDGLLGLLPVSRRVKDNYAVLLLKLHEGPPVSSKPIDFAFLQPIRDDFFQQIDSLRQTRAASVEIRMCTWPAVLDAINKEMKDRQDKEKAQEYRYKTKDLDPYLLAETSVERMTFVVHEDSEVVVEEEPEPVPQKEEEPEEVKSEDEKEEKGKPQRASRRLAKETFDEVEVIPLYKEQFRDTTIFRDRLQEFLGSEIEVADLVGDFLDGKGYVGEFLSALNLWDLSMTQALFAEDKPSKSNEDEKIKLLEVLRSFASSDKDLSGVPQLAEVEPPRVVGEFLNGLNGHYESNKVSILNHLVGTRIATTCWLTKLYERVREWVNHTENHLLQFWTLNGLREADHPLAIGIYEVFVDAYIGLKDHITKRNLKVGLSPMMVDLVTYGDKLARWKRLLDTYPPQGDLLVRYKWATMFKIKAQNTSWEDNQAVAVQFQELAAAVSDINIPLPNYTHISEITRESINYQAITSLVLSIFAKVLYSNGNAEAVSLLESILIPEAATTGLMSIEHLHENSLVSTRSFLDKYPVDMKLNLWNILFSYYNDKDKQKFQLGFEQYLRFLLEYFESHSGLSQILVKVIGRYGDTLKVFLRHLNAGEWRLTPQPVESTKRTLAILLKFLELLCQFKLHEEGALLSGLRVSLKTKSTKSHTRLTDMFIHTLCLFVVYYREFIKNVHSEAEETMCNLLTLAHYQLSLTSGCDGASGIFLKLSQDILLSQSYILEAELAQLISCRFHYTVHTDTYTPVDHRTSQTGELDTNSSAELAKFVLPICFRQNPLVFAPKADMKSLIDGLYEVVGDPDFEHDEVLALNNESFKYFLELTPISAKFLKQAYYGLVKLDLDVPSTTNQELIKDGLYYLQALLIFNSYKIRKKSMQSRAVELEHIITLLRNDLIFCTNRTESWFLLGQAYGFLVEDDLIWTSDKLTIPDRKVSTANLQRKSLLCYLMAINQAAANQDGEAVKPIVSLLMSSFAKQAYGAVMEPMGMHAFRVQSNPRFVKGAYGALFAVENTFKADAKRQLILKIVQQLLLVAVKAKRLWLNYYYLHKVQRKLNKPFEIVLELLHEAARLALEENTPEPIMEPHYRLCSVLYKYVKEGKMSPEKGVEYLRQSDFIELGDSEIAYSTDKEYFQTIVNALRKLINSDKKRWHHKPRYRLARILFDEFGDVAGAKEEMSSIVTIKATSKTLVSIWKPEHERPGTHFFYTYQYSQFFIELLRAERNLISLIQMLPKLRRSNSTMINLYNVWELLCLTICRMIRGCLDVGDSFTFTDNFLQSYLYLTFITISRLALDAMRSSGIPDTLKTHVCFLFAINDMKKFNNGFGPTSLIDDTIVAIYIRIFLHYQATLTITESTDLPNGKVKKLAKRDVFPFANDILNSFRRDIEKILKDRPQLYNESLGWTKEDSEKNALAAALKEKAVEDTANGVATETPANEPKVEGKEDSKTAAPVTPEAQVEPPQEKAVEIKHETDAHPVPSTEGSEVNVNGAAPEVVEAKAEDKEEATSEQTIAEKVDKGKVEPALDVPLTDPSENVVVETSEVALAPAPTADTPLTNGHTAAEIANDAGNGLVKEQSSETKAPEPTVSEPEPVISELEPTVPEPTVPEPKPTTPDSKHTIVAEEPPAKRTRTRR